jgi:hypothetical protein
MAKRAGARSGIGIGSVGGQRMPRSEVQVPQRRGSMTKSCSPHGAGQRNRRSYRRGR